MWRAASSAVRPHMPMPPRPPALLTAAARAGVVIIPIGASMIGNLRFSRWVRGFDGHIVPSRRLAASTTAHSLNGRIVIFRQRLERPERIGRLWGHEDPFAPRRLNAHC